MFFFFFFIFFFTLLTIFASNYVHTISTKGEEKYSHTRALHTWCADQNNASATIRIYYNIDDNVIENARIIFTASSLLREIPDHSVYKNYNTYLMYEYSVSFERRTINNYNLACNSLLEKYSLKCANIFFYKCVLILCITV